jgi:DNA polymerase III subunit delta'
MVEMHPKYNESLYGHEAAERQLLRDAGLGRLAHGWLISGPRGIGKATLAYRFARAMLAGTGALGMPSDHPVFKRVASGGHADLLVVEPAFDAKKGEEAREISVEQAREVAQFLSLTPGESQWRVVIIDPIDQLNTNAANAILKILEEPPPQALLLLVSHNPGALLPTIRSRCRNLRLSPLTRGDFRHVMQRLLPSLDDGRLETLGQLTDFSPGLAAMYEGQGACELYADILELMATPEPEKIHAFSNALSGDQPHLRFQLFAQLALIIHARVCKAAAGANPAMCAGEGEAVARLAAMHSAQAWAVKWQQASEQFLLAQRLHLDYKQVVITFFHSVASKEPLAA